MAACACAVTSEMILACLAPRFEAMWPQPETSMSMVLPRIGPGASPSCTRSVAALSTSALPSSPSLARQPSDGHSKGPLRDSTFFV